jgi:hypothetical protein
VIQLASKIARRLSTDVFMSFEEENQKYMKALYNGLNI